MHLKCCVQKLDVEKRLDTLEGLWAVRRLVQWSANPDHYLLTMDSLHEVNGLRHGAAAASKAVT